MDMNTIMALLAANQGAGAGMGGMAAAFGDAGMAAGNAFAPAAAAGPAMPSMIPNFGGVSPGALQGAGVAGTPAAIGGPLTPAGMSLPVPDMASKLALTDLDPEKVAKILQQGQGAQARPMPPGAPAAGRGVSQMQSIQGAQGPMKKGLAQYF